MTAAITRYQRGLTQVRNEVVRSLVPLFSTLDEADLNRSFPGYAQRASGVIREGEQAAARLAVQFYSEAREAEQVPGDVPKRPPQLAEARHVNGSLFLSGPIEVKRAIAQGASTEQAMRRGQAATAGAASRLALNAGRHHVETLVVADEQAVGYQRVIKSAKPCAFCAMLASRGAVYKAGRYPPRTKYHDHCSCAAIPLFKGSKQHQQAQFYAELWKRTTKGKRGKDAVNAFRQALNEIQPREPATPDYR